MNLIARLRADKPHHLKIISEDKESEVAQEKTETIRVLRGKGNRGSWQRIDRTLDAIEWLRVETRDEDDNLIGAYTPEPDDSDDDAQPPDPRDSLPIEDPDVAKYKVLTSAILTVLEPFNRFAEITMGKQDQLFDMVLGRMEALENARKEDNEFVRKQIMQQSKETQEMNSAMGTFGSILKQIAPDLAKGALDNFLPGLFGAEKSTGGNGVKFPVVDADSETDNE